MTTIAQYAARGRWALWGAASAHMYLELTDDEGDYFKDALAIAGWGMATGALLIPEVGSTLIGFGLTKSWQALGWVARAAGPPVAAAVSTVVAPVAAGYLIGATAGTIVANEIWGEEGAKTALGFYSAGLLPGTETPDLTDYQYIFKPTAPGGPMSLYDVSEAGVKVVAKTVERFYRRWRVWNRWRPRY